jgi:Protein of unknown function (DUF3226)
VADNEEQKRLGIWIMPDNRSEGSLETFLRHLVPDQSEPAWKHAIESVEAAAERMSNALRMVLTVSKDDLLKEEARQKRKRQRKRAKKYSP